MSEEVGQLLIAAEALVMLAKIQLDRYDKMLKVLKRNEDGTIPWKNRDKYQDLRDNYWHLYDDIYTVIADLKKRHSRVGVVGFIERHLDKVLDIAGDRIKETDELAKRWEKVALNPLDY